MCIRDRYRPRPPAEAFLRLRTLPGEQGQVDWGHFGRLQIGQAKRELMAFVMVLSWSRQVFVRFYLGHAMAQFLRGHVEAFAFFGGVPRVLLYDNLKSAVLERQGDAIRFHPMLLELARLYHFDPRPCAPARGNEKGRIRCTDPVLYGSGGGPQDGGRWTRGLQPDGVACSGGGIVSLPAGRASSLGSRRARVRAQYLGASSR